jgi:DNA-binding transcriptional MerR regulator
MFKIQEFSKRTSVSKRMLRYLEEQGLLVPSRQDNDYRTYQSAHLEEIQWIQFWQRLGFALSEIKSLKKMNRTDVEKKIESLRTKTKQDLQSHVEQLELLKQVTHKIKESGDQDQWQSISAELDGLQTWSSETRGDFLAGLKESDRIVYGQFNEIEKFTDLFLQELKALGKTYTLQSNLIIKVRKAIEDLPAAEVQVWESKKDYTYFLGVFPDSSSESSDFEDHLPELLERSLSASICSLKLDDVGRLFSVRDINQFSGQQEMCFLMHFRSNEMNDFYFMVPFQFVHSNRQGLNAGSIKVSRKLRRSILSLSEEQILQNTKEMPNQDYLLTLLLADAETKHKIFQSLSPQGKEAIRGDLKDVVQKIEALWK